MPDIDLDHAAGDKAVVSYHGHKRKKPQSASMVAMDTPIHRLKYDRKQLNTPEQVVHREFQKCERMTRRLELDRSVTTLGFTSLRRHRQQTSKSVRILTANDPEYRAKTAPVQSQNRTLTAGVQSERSTGSSRPRANLQQPITMDILIEILTERGLGEPKAYRYPPLPPETAIPRGNAYRCKIAYYMEKLKGRSRLDSEIANAKALAFCEEQKDASQAERKGRTLAVANGVDHFPEVFIKDKANQFGEGRSLVGSKTVNTLAETGSRSDHSEDKKQVMFTRITTWIDGCQKASAKGYQFVELDVPTNIT